MAAAYELTFNCTDDESFQFGFTLLDDDGTPFPWDDFNAEYSLRGCGQTLLLTKGDGITIETDENDEVFVRVQAPVDFRLRPGSYSHGFRVIEIASGRPNQIFDGGGTSTEGNF